MARFIEISLTRREARCVARLLDEEAPRTAQAIWDALPQEGDAYHAKYARNEVYALVPAFADPEPGYENTTVTPIPGDVVYFAFQPWQLAKATHGYQEDGGPAGGSGAIVDLAVFYARNNLLLTPDFGFSPGNVFASVVEGLPGFAEACQDVWRAGAVDERLAFRRLEAG